VFLPRKAAITVVDSELRGAQLVGAQFVVPSRFRETSNPQEALLEQGNNAVGDTPTRAMNAPGALVLIPQAVGSRRSGKYLSTVVDFREWEVEELPTVGAGIQDLILALAQHDSPG